MTMSEPTVFIVDDDAGVRDSLSLLLGLRNCKTQCFGSAEDFLSTYDPGRSGCLLLDVKMVNMNGLELQARLSEAGATLPIVMISAFGDIPTVRAALRGGAIDFLEKPIDDQALLAAVIEAIERDNRIRQAQDRHQVAGRNIDRLTRREQDVLKLLAQGLPNRVIATHLGISHRTVEIYKARVLEKMQVATVPELIRLMLENPAFDTRAY